MNSTMSRIEPTASERSASPILVKANLPSRRSFSRPLLANARISRYSASGCAPTRSAMSAGRRGPLESWSATPSLAATQMIWVVHAPVASSRTARPGGTVERWICCRTARTRSIARTNRTGGTFFCFSGMSSVEVVAQDLGTAGMAQLGHGLGLDLPDAFAGDAVHLADLVECAGLTVGESEPQPHHAGLALGQRFEHRLQLVLQQRERHRVHGHHGLTVLDEVAELAVALIADRLVERDRLTRVLLDLQHLLRRDVHFLGKLFGR